LSCLIFGLSLNVRVKVLVKITKTSTDASCYIIPSFTLEYSLQSCIKSVNHQPIACLFRGLPFFDDRRKTTWQPQCSVPHSAPHYSSSSSMTALTLWKVIFISLLMIPLSVLTSLILLTDRQWPLPSPQTLTKITNKLVKYLEQVFQS